MDMIRRKESQEDAERAAEQMRIILQGVADGIAAWTPAGLVYANDAYARILGFEDAKDLSHTPVDVISRRFRTLDPEGREIPLDQLPAQVAFSGKPCALKARLLLEGTSEEKWVYARSTPVFDEEGSVRLAIIILQDLTESQRAEKSIQESRDQLGAILQGVADAVTAHDPEGNLLFANDAAARKLGFLEAGEMLAAGTELYAKRFESLVTLEGEDLRSGEFPIWKQIGLEKPPVTLKFKLADGKGDTTFVLARFRGVYGEEGRLKLVISTYHDITARVVAEQEVERQVRLIRTITDNATSALFLMNDQQQCTFMNPAAVRMTGYTLEETRGKALHDVIHHTRPDGRPYPLEECPIDRALPQKNQETGEDVFIRKDGTFYPVSFTASPILENGTPVGTVIEVDDITERKAAEEERKHSRSQLELALNAAEIGAWEYDLVKGTIYWDLRTREIFGVPEPATVTYPEIVALIHPEDRDSVDALVKAALSPSGDGHYQAQYRLRNPDGRIRWVLARGMATFSGEGHDRAAVRFSGVVLDTTEQRRAEEARKEAEERLHQAQKMEAMGRLAGGIAHDFNNLLTAINGYSDLLTRSLPAATANHEFALEIKRAGERAASLTHQLLAYSRKQVLQKKPLAMNETVLQMQAMLKRLIGEDITLESTTEPELARVEMDPGQLEQVILNLALNARDAMPNGGRLILETENVLPGKGPRKPHPDLKDVPYVRLTITDTGIGMDPETRAHLFEPFFTTKDPGKGTGLGLSTVFGIVQQAEGAIAVESEPGKGSRFEVYLPAMVETPSAEMDLPQKPVNARMGKRETLLLVEDEQVVRNFIRQVLESSGYRVLEAANGEEAIEVLNRFASRVDLLITDVVMPKMGGAELVERLAGPHPELQVLFLSGYTSNASIADRLGSYAEFLSKPFTAPVLLEKVERILMKSPASRGPE